MKKFKKVIFKKNSLVHCETQEQANELLYYADKKGLTWCTGNKYIINENNWHVHKKDTCYNLYLGTYGGIYNYDVQRGHKILKFEDVVKKQKNKKKQKKNKEFNFEKDLISIFRDI